MGDYAINFNGWKDAHRRFAVDLYAKGWDPQLSLNELDAPFEAFTVTPAQLATPNKYERGGCGLYLNSSSDANAAIVVSFRALTGPVTSGAVTLRLGEGFTSPRGFTHFWLVAPQAPAGDVEIVIIKDPLLDWRGAQRRY